MVITKRFESLEAAITAFSAESKPTMREYARHRYYSPDAHRKHHRAARSAGANNRRDKKPQRRRH